MGEFAIMNNTPYHFWLAVLSLGTFAVALFTSDANMKSRLRQILMVLFALQIISGIMVWTIVPFSLALLIKSVGGLFLMWLLLQLINAPSNRTYWILTVLTAVVGLWLAFFYI